MLGSIYYVNPRGYERPGGRGDPGQLCQLPWWRPTAWRDKTAKFRPPAAATSTSTSPRRARAYATGLYNDLLECLQNKTGGTAPLLATAASDNNDGYWGGNYVEIDLTSQHLWLYRNSECIVSCGVVSGCVANNPDPHRHLTIFAKNTDRYLNGSNIDGSTYHTGSTTSCPFSGGCGIHDATWRSSFGGTQYLYEGSHGCVGVSLGNAKTIYNNVSVGTHVVVYGGASPNSIPPREQSISVTASSTNLVIGDQATVSVFLPDHPPVHLQQSRRGDGGRQRQHLRGGCGYGGDQRLLPRRQHLWRGQRQGDHHRQRARPRPHLGGADHRGAPRGGHPCGAGEGQGPLG